MKFSLGTLLLGAYMILSSFFMRRIWEIMEAALGLQSLGVLFVCCVALLTFGIIKRGRHRGLGNKKLAQIILLCVGGFMFSWRQPYPSEKAHVIQFALLGWLAARDQEQETKTPYKALFMAFLFVLLIGALEEGYQKLLPWRVCDARDILTDTIGGMLGVILYKISSPLKTIQNRLP